MARSKPPNPGSRDAIDLGCSCPRMDNNNGLGLGGGRFWITGGCPLHAPVMEVKKLKKASKKATKKGK